jgi:hypothetical protein
LHTEESKGINKSILAKKSKILLKLNALTGEHSHAHGKEHYLDVIDYASKKEDKYLEVLKNIKTLHVDL